MVTITAAARAQIEALERHYADLGRDVAVIRMAEAIARAAIRIEEQVGPFRSAPRPYPDLVDLGFSWLKAGRYWIAFAPSPSGYAITGVFFETADIPRRA